MPTLNIKNPRVYELARQASDATGTSMTSVIELALEKLLAELSRPRPGTAARLHELTRTSAPLLRDLPPDPFEALYDERTGAPR